MVMINKEIDVSSNKILILKLSQLYCLYIVRYRISSINIDIIMAVFSETKKQTFCSWPKHNVILSRAISDVLSVCGLCSNKAIIEVPCPIKKWWVSK